MLAMKKLILIVLLLISTSAFAASINAAAYRTMQMQSYQRSRARSQSQRQIPYWQAQSNYTTRNRVYTSYPQSKTNYNNQYYGGR